VAKFVSVPSLMAQARQWSDTSTAPNPSDSDVLGFVNQSFGRFYDFLVEAYGEDYFFESAFFTTTPPNSFAYTLGFPFDPTAGGNTYPLPSDYYKMRLVDVQLQGGANPTYSPVQRYDEALRDGFNFGSQQAIPPGVTFRLQYIPTSPTLVQFATQFIPSSNGIDGITFTAVQAGPYGNNIAIQTFAPNAIASVVVNALTIKITPLNNSTAAQVVAQVLASPAAVALVTPSASLGTDIFNTVQALTPLGGTTQVDFIQNWERYVICDVAAMILTRLDRDCSSFLAERDRLEEKIRDVAETRDAGFPLVAKDNQLEAASVGPFSPFFIQRYGYTVQGGNIILLRMGLA
jgi:hypothetical protein